MLFSDTLYLYNTGNIPISFKPFRMLVSYVDQSDKYETAHFVYIYKMNCDLKRKIYFNMLFIVFLSNFLCRKNDFIIKPASSQNEILRIYGNMALRIDDSPLSAKASHFFLIRISDLGNDYKSLKIAQNYICAPEEGNILTVNEHYDSHNCAWTIENNHDNTQSLRNGKNYLVKSEEMDNRARSRGYKLRVLPPNAARNFKWEIKSPSQFEDMEDDDEDTPVDLKKLPADQNKTLTSKPQNVKSTVVGVSAPLKMPVSKN